MKNKFQIFLLILLIGGFSQPAKVLAKTSQVFADKIRIEKSKRTMTLYQNNQVLKTYRISLGTQPVGAKTQQGDGKTPEGIYTISTRNKNSLYHRSLKISYPNPGDRKRAQDLGVAPGGDVFIHGLPNSAPDWGQAHLLADWTLGCIAVTNPEIEEIWELVPDGTVVEIIP